MNLRIENITRTGKCKEERSFAAISFRLENKADSALILAEDGYYERTWDVHFHGFSKLAEHEQLTLLRALISYLQPGHYLGRAGHSKPEEKAWWNILTAYLEETDSVRVLKDTDTGNPTYWNILRK